MTEEKSKEDALNEVFKALIEVIQQSAGQWDGAFRSNSEQAVRDHGTDREIESMESAKRSLAMATAAHAVENSAIGVLRMNWDRIVKIATKK